MNEGTNVLDKASINQALNLLGERFPYQPNNVDEFISAICHELFDCERIDHVNFIQGRLNISKLDATYISDTFILKILKMKLEEYLLHTKVERTVQQKFDEQIKATLKGRDIRDVYTKSELVNMYTTALNDELAIYNRENGSDESSDD
jgi:hypothetical protein